MNKRIEQDIREQIKSGFLSPGDKIIPENELTKQYKTTHYQVRIAICNLKTKGLIYSIPKKGVFVAEQTSETQVESKDMIPKGFNIAEIAEYSKPGLKFAISAWNIVNRRIWKKVCHDFSEKNFVDITPVFIRDFQEYRQAVAECDIFTEATTIYCNEELIDNLYRWPSADIKKLPVEKKYVKWVDSENGAVGIPLLSNLMGGVINRKLVSTHFEKQLRNKETWSDVFELLWEILLKREKAEGININPHRTLNLFHFLMINAGDMVDTVKQKISLRHPDFLSSLQLLEFWRNKLFHRSTENGTVDQENIEDFLTRFSYMCQYPANFKSKPHFLPWLHPVGAGGHYVESLNIGVISKRCPCLEEARNFLLYLVSQPVQHQFASVPAEHPVSTEVSEPFGGYPDDWQSILKTVRRNASALYEIIPGYCPFSSYVLYPLARKFFNNEISATAFIDQAEERGNMLIRNARSRIRRLPEDE